LFCSQFYHLLSGHLQIVLAQTDHDKAILQLLKKLGEVYEFMMQDNTLGGIPSMQSIVGRIVQQTLECSQFIKDYSATKNFCEEAMNYCALLIRSSVVIIGLRLGENVNSETDDTTQKYIDVLDELMQNFRDQVTRDVEIFIHRTSKGSTRF
jgi:hypothetical protein